MPVSREDIRNYQRRVNELKSKADKLSEATRTRILNVVDIHRLAIKDIMTDFHGEDATLLAKAGLKMSAEVQVEINAMADDVNKILEESTKRSYDYAVREANTLYETIGEAGMFRPSPALFAISRQFSADLVRTVSQSLMSEVNAIISRSVVGGLSPFDAMKAVDSAIGRAGESGVSFQAERIVRTEMTRVYNITLDQSINDLVPLLDSPEKLKKVWISGAFRPGRRENHQAADGQEVPIDEPFKIRSDDGSIVELDYPQALGPETDPRKLAKETIMCGCSWEIVAESILEAI